MASAIKRFGRMMLFAGVCVALTACCAGKPKYAELSGEDIRKVRKRCQDVYGPITGNQHDYQALASAYESLLRELETAIDRHSVERLESFVQFHCR